MSQQALIEKLAKANRDVKRLCEFFAARKGWQAAPDAGDAARSLADAASTMDEHLKALISSSGMQPSQPDYPEVALFPVGTFDRGRLQRFASFLRDLDTWFAAQTWAGVSSEDVGEFQKMEAYLACIIELIEAGPTIEDPATVAVSEADGATQVTVPGDAPGKAIPEGAPLQLVLDDTNEQPMIQEFQGIKELTAECQQAVDDFLAAWDLDYSYIKRKKLLERLLRWITSAPEGHVLVMKMKTAEEPFEPYPSYVSREVLAGNPPQQNPW